MIAVTGANGLLGSHIVRKLLEQNKPFIALKRRNSDTSLLRDVEEAITWREADILDPVSVEEALQGVTHVIHAAAFVSFNPLHERTIYEVNFLGTRNIVNACLHADVRRLVHISSVAALGRTRDQTWIDETNKWSDSALNTHYARSKYMAELEVFRGQKEGLSTVIVNPSVILAPADWNKSSARLFRYVWNERPFYIDAYLNYVDVRDVVQVVCEMIYSEWQAERFILNSGNISFQDFFTKIAITLGKKPPSIKVNRTALKLLSMLEDMRCRISRAEPLISRETARLAGTNFFYSSEKVKKALNFEFKPIEETIQWCCQYYIEQVKGKK